MNFMLIKTVQYLNLSGAPKYSIIVADNKYFNSFGEQSNICSIQNERATPRDYFMRNNIISIQ